jgi:hypothetical protein
MVVIEMTVRTMIADKMTVGKMTVEVLVEMQTK